MDVTESCGALNRSDIRSLCVSGSLRRGGLSVVTVRLVSARSGTSVGTLRLTQGDATVLAVSEGNEVQIGLGKWTGKAIVRTASGLQSTLTLPTGAPQLPVRTMALHPVGPGRLRLGPLIGILVMYRVTGRGPKGSQMSTYREIMYRARQVGGMAFVLRASTLKRSGRRVVGWTRVNGRWRRCRLPYPDVVYNRISSRPVERQVRRAGGFTLLRRRGVPVFNPHYLDKWGVHRTLINDESVRPHLPETKRYRSPADVADLLSRHGRVFLKPAGGSLGLGAMLITWSGGRLHYKLNTMSGGRRSGTLRSVRALRRVLPRRSDYLAQQAIRLARVQGRSFDVRALVQKDPSGEWLLTGAAARIAGRGRITTHVPRGGSRRPLMPVLREVFGPERAAAIREELERVCVAAGRGLERLSGKLFGEFSLDVGIDVAGRIWILEMNAKPFRFDERPLRVLAQRRLIRFATHLAGCPVEPASRVEVAGVGVASG